MRTICCVVCWLLVSVQAFGQDRLLWEVQEDFSGGPDLARAITLSKRTAVIVGTAGAPDGGFDFVIQSFSKSTGAVQWTDHVPSCCGASPVVVTSLRDSVFAAGYVSGPTVGSTDSSSGHTTRRPERCCGRTSGTPDVMTSRRRSRRPRRQS